MPAVHFTPAELGLSGSVYLYDYFSGQGRQLNSNETFSAPLGKKASAFYVVAPVGQSGVALLGDKDKFVGTSKQRITSLEDKPASLSIGVVLAANETAVTLHGFADSAPIATVVAGDDDAVQYNPATHYFTVRINADTNAPVDKSAADPVQRLTVILRTQKQ